MIIFSSIICFRFIHELYCSHIIHITHRKDVTQDLPLKSHRATDTFFTPKRVEAHYLVLAQTLILVFFPFYLCG